MATDNFLYANLEGRAFRNRILAPQTEDIRYISQNLKYKLFEWQEQALLNFLTYEQIREKESIVSPNHLLFNMATGSGKTMVMASLILHHYKLGYRQFLFFVNQKNIVSKTEENFINPYHSKYLFADNIIMDGNKINIRKVDTFSDDSDDIQIKFTTIHQLHNDIYKIKENSLELEDLQNRNLVLLGDEAHHLNSSTRKGKNEQLDILEQKELRATSKVGDIERSWEHTVVDLILNRKGARIREGALPNVLLEFTATIKEAGKDVLDKYRDKMIYRFDLPDFRNAGYTKEINLVASSFSRKERVLQALLFNWYRQYLATKNGIRLKPVILFRSKEIEDSRADYESFGNLIINLSVKDFAFLSDVKINIGNNGSLFEVGYSRIERIKKLIDSEEVDLRTIVENIKSYFSVSGSFVITNSKDNKKKSEDTSEDLDRQLNSLEDRNNPIRAIFTVQRLTEGWDVLNLYDIVRLYESRDTGRAKAGSSTVSEVQLIGRGVRYYPYAYKDNIPNKRKFDGDIGHELRLLEELYFHTNDDVRYISELKNELKRKDLSIDDKVIQEFDLKPEFKNHTYFNAIHLWGNKQISNPKRQKKSLDDIKQIIEPFFYDMTTQGYEIVNVVLDKEKADNIRESSQSEDSYSLHLNLSDFDKHIVRKALNRVAQKDNSIYRFNNFQKEVASSSIKHFIENENYLGNLKIHIAVDNSFYHKLKKQYKLSTHAEFVTFLDREEVLNALIQLFTKVETEWKKTIVDKIGSDFEFTEKLINIFSEPKRKLISKDEQNQSDIVNESWYMLNRFHGTDQELYLAEFLKQEIGNFKEEFDEVYLLRNEEVYKIYDFETGAGFQPDFLLFLKSNNSGSLYYQVFIEPKGKHLLEHDEWKNQFLKSITKKYGSESILIKQNKSYKLVGLPLYNNESEGEFRDSIKRELDVDL